MSTYRKVREKLADQSGQDDTVVDLLPCRYCGVQTKRETLSLLGARCRECFAQYQRLGYSGGQPPREAAQAGWVKAEAAKVREKRAGLGPLPGLEALSEAIRRRAAARDQLRGLGDDEVNAMLASGGDAP